MKDTRGYFFLRHKIRDYSEKAGYFLGVVIFLGVVSAGCNKKSSATQPPNISPAFFKATSVKIDAKSATTVNYYINTRPVIRFNFSASIDRGSVSNSVSFSGKSGAIVSFNITYENTDSD